ncbi:hypothetical protein TNCV_2745451 [Trichonephila clavipes]|nr:hypothetical protein TNCV_2745451 [Trichonephila clavipes]
MHTSKYRNSTEVGLLPIESVDYCSVISPFALVESQPLSCEYGINGLLRVVQNKKNGCTCAPNDKAGYRINVVISDEYWFCVQYSDGHIRVWELRGDRSSPACIRYQHRWGATSGVMVWANGDNLKADWCISDILRSQVVYYLQGLCPIFTPFQQDNIRSHVARRVLTLFDA